MQQISLFEETTKPLPVTYYPDFLTVEEANELYKHCQKLQWQRSPNQNAG